VPSDFPGDESFGEIAGRFGPDQPEMATVDALDLLGGQFQGDHHEIKTARQ
jgi:hypothetical protein